MARRRLLVLVLAPALAFTCPDERGQPASAPGERVGSPLARATTPAPADDLAATVASGTDFALDLHRALAAGRENVFSSPQSVAFALSMAFAGAAGETATAFETTLHLSLPEAAHHRAMNDLSRQLASRGAGAAGTSGEPFRLTLVNQLFGRRGLAFEAPFLDVLAGEYGADARLLDFAGAPEPSRRAINDWVALATEDRIRDLLAEGTIGADTAAVLVNAVYFNAAWATPFPVSATTSRPFTLLDGTRKDVPTMHLADVAVDAGTVDGVEVVELPYDGGELSMVILAPPAGHLAAFEAQLTAARLEQLLDAIAPEHLSLHLPRFEVRTSASLVPPLSQLGLAVAFDPDRADFSRITTAAPLVLTDVVHEAFVKVDEAGTEAAAATAVVVGITSVPVTREVAIDRPFVFLVRDDATGAVVFLGRLASP